MTSLVHPVSQDMIIVGGMNNEGYLPINVLAYKCKNKSSEESSSGKDGGKGGMVSS